MAPLEGETLGQKHKHFNKLVREAVSKKARIDQTLSGDDDVENLLKIEVACKTRNVDFLLNIYKSEDTLFVSRAIKNSKWLITDKQYAHIVNPEYLFSELSLEMTSKSFHKLLLSVRLNLKDEERVETFYNYIGERNRKDSFKWLQHCSIAFIKKEVVKHCNDISSDYLRRLLERDISVFEAIMKTSSYNLYQLLRDSIFLITVDTEKYLGAIESTEWVKVKFSAKRTKILLKKCPNRIIEKFDFYSPNIDLPTLAKYLHSRQELKTFLLKQLENSKLKWLFTFQYLEHFLKYMSKDEKFAFVKKVIIDKDFPKGECEKSDFVGRCGQQFFSTATDNIYQWYKYVPFDEALPDLKKLIRSESTPATRNLILQVLLSCAGRNANNVRTVLKYYFDKHINEPYKFKIKFVNMFLSNTNSHEFDTETWSMLNQLFQSMEVYVESNNNTPSCIKAIIVRHVIIGEEVPEIIKDKFSFETLKEFQTKLKKQQDKDAVFNYLNKYLISKHDALQLISHSDLGDAITICQNQVNLWNDWKKELKDLTYLKDRVKYLIAINQEKSWNADMKSLYNFNNIWRKELFNVSITLHPSQEVCINALKHDPALLLRHKNEIEAILKNDTINLKILLSKIRIFWSTSLAEEWKKSYLSRLDKPGGHKSLVNGLYALLPPQQLNQFALKYAPSESKIDWNEIDEFTISLQKQIAKRLSKTRPLASLETVMLYAKGDYLQFAVPSLHSVLSQMSTNNIRKFLPLLWDSPISLQKFGVRYSFSKLSSQELKPTIKETWNSTKNSSIRTVLFTHTHQLLCKEKNPTNIEDIWEILSMFIDSLTAEENKDIYKKLGDITHIPSSIKPQYFVKSFIFLKSLPTKANCQSLIDDMKCKSPDVMENLDEDFVINILLKNIDENFKTSTENMYDHAVVTSAFMLLCKDEETATRRFELFLGPLLDRNLPHWYHVHDNEFKVKGNVENILVSLVNSLKNLNLVKNMSVPVKCYENVLAKLEASLSIDKDYCLITIWRLAVALVRQVKAHKDVLNTEESDDVKYRQLHVKMAPGFAKAVVDILKNDLNNNPFLYVPFAKAFQKFYDSYFSGDFFNLHDLIEHAKRMLEYSTDKEVYLIVYFLLKRHTTTLYDEKDKQAMKEIRKILYSHPAKDLKIFYYMMFNESPDLDIEV